MPEEKPTTIEEVDEAERQMPEEEKKELAEIRKLHQESPGMKWKESEEENKSRLMRDIVEITRGNIDEDDIRLLVLVLHRKAVHNHRVKKSLIHDSDWQLLCDALKVGYKSALKELSRLDDIKKAIEEKIEKFQEGEKSLELSWKQYWIIWARCARFCKVIKLVRVAEMSRDHLKVVEDLVTNGWDGIDKDITGYYNSGEDAAVC